MTTQGCSLARGIQLDFFGKDVRIRPFEVSTRDKRHKFSHARIKTSIEAAELIERENCFETPVNLFIDDTLQNRYYIPTDGIEYGEDQAWIELLDPLKILETETISGSWQSTTLSEMVDEIFSRRSDPNNVLVSIEILNAELANRRIRTPEGVGRDVSDATVPDAVPGSNKLEGAAGFFTKHTTKVGDFLTGTDREKGGFDFDKADLYSALQKIERQFGVVVWADRFGRVKIGLPQFQYRDLISVVGDPSIDEVNIAQYNVGTSRNSLKYLQGRSTDFRVRYKEKRGTNPSVHRSAYYVAAVSTPSVEDGNVGEMYDNPIDVDNKIDLEKKLKRIFLDSYMSHNGGSIEFTGMSSKDKESLAQLTVGDYITVTPEIKKICERAVEGGNFVVKSVQHQINPRAGWQVTVQVTRMPPPIEVESWVYDYESDRRFESIEEIQDEF